MYQVQQMELEFRPVLKVPQFKSHNSGTSNTLEKGRDKNADRLRGRFFSVFRPLLPLWVSSVKKRAKEQVERVLELDSDWNETVLDLGGVFNSCSVTWTQVNWPELKAWLPDFFELLKPYEN